MPSTIVRALEPWITGPDSTMAGAVKTRMFPDFTVADGQGDRHLQTKLITRNPYQLDDHQ